MTKQEYQAMLADIIEKFPSEETPHPAKVMCEWIKSLEAENAALTLLHTQATDQMIKMQNRVHELEAEISQVKKDKLEFNAQCFHKDETISVLKNRIAELEFDNRSLVEQINKMALKPNQAVIEYFYPKYNHITKRLENLPTKECLCIVELYSGEYEIVWWISAGFEETGWDGYCVDEVKSWAYLPAPPKEEKNVYKVYLRVVNLLNRYK